MTPRQVFIREATGFVRELSWRDALVLNLQSMGLGWPLIYIGVAPYLFPGDNLPLSVILALPVVFLLSLTFISLSITMPRTGGDFVWCTRILHPAIGFMESFAFTFFMASFIGSLTVWVINPGLVTILYNSGIITGNMSLVDLANSLIQPNVLFVTGVLCVTILAIPALLGTRSSFRFQWVMLTLIFLGFFSYLIAMLGAGHAAFVARFNALSGMNYDAVVKTAQSAGYFTGFSTFGLFCGIMWSIGNIWGFQFSTYVGGEVKNVSKSQIWAILGSLVIVGLMQYLMYGVSYQVMGQEFVHAVAFLGSSGNPAYKLIGPPAGTFLVVFATGNPILTTLVPFIIIASYFGSLEALLMVCVRNVFAWSFDRIVPTKLADVNERFHSPHYAVLAIFVAAMLFVYASVYSSLLSALSYALTGQAIACIFVGLAAVVLGWRRKDLLELAPNFAKKRIGGIPLLSWFGAITVVLSFAIAAATISPAYLGGPINPVWLLVLFGTFLVALPIYAVSYYYRKSKGIDMALAFKQIPPE